MARVGLILILLLGLAVGLTGLTWGLPSRRADRFLFPEQQPWSGQRLMELKGRDWDRRAGLGADVDINPLARRDRPIDLTTDDRERAEILIRYRLYTHQPDEASPLRALAGMRPSRLELDPKLYQYGGLFIYPAGAMIGLCTVTGWVDARHDLAYFLDHPDAFGRLYVVVRTYSMLFGLAGIIACYFLGWRLDGAGAGLLAAALFVCMPVVITMSHEGKPHLAGAVLTLLAALMAMRYVETGRSAHWWAMTVLSGLTMGMVLSGWPVVGAMVVAALQRPQPRRLQTAGRLVGGILIALLVYLLVNPYVAINLVGHREILRSNLQTSTGMYEIGRFPEGIGTVVRLLIEAAGVAVALVGTVGIVVLLLRRDWKFLPAIVPAGLIVLQFACIGAGKPGEYGRFLVFPSVVLGAMAAWAAVSVLRRSRMAGAALVLIIVLGTGWDGYRYLRGFVHDAGPANTRSAAARWLLSEFARQPTATIGVVREPAPYCVPPLDFPTRRMVLLPPQSPGRMKGWPDYVVATVDRLDALERAWWRHEYRMVASFPANLDCWFNRPALISWADKPVIIFRRVTAKP
jgi:hypothetical protein